MVLPNENWSNFDGENKGGQAGKVSENDEQAEASQEAGHDVALQ